MRTTEFTTNRWAGYPNSLSRVAGWSRIDLGGVIAILCLLLVGSLLLPSFTKARARASRISCVNNLKQVGTAYRVWAGDNGERFPWEVPAAGGGWRELAFSSNAARYCWTNYALMGNELGQSPRVVLCPDDVREAKTNFNMTDNSGISFFVGINASDRFPGAMLGGDRNLGPGEKPQNDFGYSPDDFTGRSVLILTNSRAMPLTWSAKMHSAEYKIKEGGGNLLMGDGSVQQMTSPYLRLKYQRHAGVPLLPEDGISTNGYTEYPSFRLIFP